MNIPRVNPTFICDCCERVTKSQDEGYVMDFCMDCCKAFRGVIVEASNVDEIKEREGCI